MSIIKNEIPILEFDSEQEAVINPIHEKLGLNLPQKCVFAFLGEYIDEYAQKNNAKKVSEFISATKHYPIYILNYGDEEITLCQAPVGSAPAAQILDWLIGYGVQEIISAGSCGGLLPFHFENEFISIDKDGNDVLKTLISEDNMEGFSEEAAHSFIPYILGDNLYFITGNSGLVYRVDPDTHALELADSEIKNQYITFDKTMFMLKAEEEVGRIYVKPENGDKTLFSAENESVILNRVNFTDYYVFYMAFQEKDFSSLYLYRVDLDGENKVLIKKIDLDENNALIKYDNEYIYLVMSDDEYLKINKETLEESNIASLIEESRVFNEVSDEKFFHINILEYCIDSATGEKINF